MRGSRRLQATPSPRRRLPSLLLMLLAILQTGACRPGRKAPVLLLVTIDTLRADHLGCYGNARAATPVIDRLAREGARFTAASTVTPLTLPAHASILTGRYPAATGVRNNGMFTLPPSEVTLAEALRSAGFATGAFVGSFVLSSSFGLSQGFDVYDETFDLRRQGPTADERRAETVDAAALRWLDGRGPGPFFLWVHYFDPHARYEPPPPFDRQFADSPYDGEIASVDRALGTLLDRLRARAGPGNLSVALAADHGEGLGEHGEATHGLFVYQSTLHVPLILWSPGHVPAGVTVTEPVSVVDLFDTTLAMVGVRAPSGAPTRHGVDLLPLVRGQTVARTIPVTFESWLSRLEFGWSELRGIRLGSSKLIEAPRSELFDLSADAAETADQSVGKPEELARLRRELEQSYADQAASATVQGSSDRPMDDETLGRLRGLGYVAGGGPLAAPAAAGGSGPALPDPKDRLQTYMLLKAAGDAVTEGPAGVRFAIATLERLLEEDPESVAGRWRYAEALLLDGRPAEVVRLLEPRLSGGPEYYWVPWLLAKAHRALGEREKALALFREGARRSPFFDRRPVEVAALLREMGRLEESLDEASRGLERYPADAALLQLAGDDCRDLHRSEPAIGFYRRALEASPGQSQAAVSLASLLTAGRRDKEAEEALAKHLAAAPASADGRRMLGLVLMNEGDFPHAIEQLRQSRSLAPTNPETAYYLVVCLSDVGRLAEADSEVEKLLRLAPSSPHSFRAQGLLRRKQGRLAESSAAYRRALAIDPSDAEAARALRELGTR